MRRISVLLAVFAVMFVGIAAAASATPPQPLTIDTTPGLVFGEGDFSSNIPGCPSGTWTDDFATVKVSGNEAKLTLNIKVSKTLVCDGDGGEFVIRFLPKLRRVDPTMQEGPWRIASGMIGDDKVHGTGWMVFDGLDLTEKFTGKIHIG